MSVTSISPNSPYLSSLQSITQPKQDFFSLANALNTGDLAGAQKAFATLQQDLQIRTQSPLTQVPLGGTIGQDFQALQKALDSGDVSEAKTVFHTLMQDLQQARGHHRHHGHHHHGEQNPTDNSGTSTNTGTSDTSPGTINVTA